MVSDFTNRLTRFIAAPDRLDAADAEQAGFPSVTPPLRDKMAFDGGPDHGTSDDNPAPSERTT